VDVSKKPLPTDLEILDWIYEQYYDEYAAGPPKSDTRDKVFLAISIHRIAKALGVDPDIVFGRLYYRLEREHTYQKDDATVHFFLRGKDIQKQPVGDRDHWIHFPLMASVLAGLRAEAAKEKSQTALTWISLGLSVLAIVVSAATAAVFGG
jgi:cytochrome oxidase assembly protein ShyY1